MSLASLLGRNPSDHVGAVGESFPNMESTLSEGQWRAIGLKDASSTHGLSCQALAKDLGIFVDEEVLDGVLIAPTRRGRGEASTACLTAVRAFRRKDGERLTTSQSRLTSLAIHDSSCGYRIASLRMAAD